MKAAERCQSVKESVTLALNSLVVQMQEQGEKVINLTAGQLPFHPPQEFVDQLQNQLHFLKSFQYSPAAGLSALGEKALGDWASSRRIARPDHYGHVISNGAKHSLSNIFACFLNPGDEVILLAPYWLTYPQVIEMFGGKCKVVESDVYHQYTCDLDEIRKVVTPQTKFLVLNSPNNPAGIHYPQAWMEGLADLLSDFPNLYVISDEIYFDLAYYDPKPFYYYQADEALLKRSFIVDGISKNLAATGLRIGYTFAPKEFTAVMSRVQGHLTSSPNTLVQKALLEFPPEAKQRFVSTVNNHLRRNADLLQMRLKERGHEQAWYQVNSAFYYFLDFKKLRGVEEKFPALHQRDCAVEICEYILKKAKVALVPSSDFGLGNAARLSLVAPPEELGEAVDAVLDLF